VSALGCCCFRAARFAGPRVLAGLRVGFARPAFPRVAAPGGLRALVPRCRFPCGGVGEVRLNEHSEYGFFDVLPGGLHPYLLEVVRDSGWRRGGGVGV